MKRNFWFIAAVLFTVAVLTTSVWCANTVSYPRNTGTDGRISFSFADDLNDASIVTSAIKGTLYRIAIKSTGTEHSWKVYVKDDTGATLFGKTDCNSTLSPYSYALSQSNLAGDCSFKGIMVSGALTVEVKDVNYSSEKQTISFSGDANAPTGGTFRLNFGGETTTALAYNASAATVQTALRALTSINGANVTCTGGAFPATPVVCTFAGTLAQRDVSAITVTTTSLTGGVGAVITATVAETKKGGNDLSEVAIDLYYSEYGK